MSGQKLKVLLGGLNLQFIAYFLLFSYLPLLTFSIIGYKLNKGLIRQVHEHNLQILARKTSRHILDILEMKANTIRYFDSVGRLSYTDNGTSEFTLLARFRNGKLENQYNLRPQLLRFLQRKEKGGSWICLDSKGKQLLFRVALDNQNAVWTAIPLEKIIQLLPSEDPHTQFSIHNRDKDDPKHIDGPVGTAARLESFYPWSAFRDDASMQYDVSLADNWIIRATRSAQGIYGELDTFLEEILVANLIIGLLMFAIAVFLARRIAAPIQQLVKAAGKFSRGDLSTPVDVKGSEEINILSDEFEVMRRQLLESYSNLEEKIEERTQALREAQFQISHQEKMASLGLLAAGVAHEIGNPLTGISSMTQIIKRKSDDSEIKGYTSTILENINRISRIVRELVDFTRPSSYEATDVDANAVIKSAVGIARYDKRAKNIDLKLDLQEPLPKLHLVEDQLQQVFINILINAMDACPGDTGKLEIRTFSDEQNVYLYFTDNGVGIPEEDKSKIFEPFFTTKQVGKGTGLGLSVTYGIIKNWNGKIMVDSKVGEGSTFKIEIPIQRAELNNEG